MHTDGSTITSPDGRHPMIIYVNPDGQLQTHLGGERRGGRKKA